jgi:hypothetical protein
MSFLFPRAVVAVVVAVGVSVGSAGLAAAEHGSGGGGGSDGRREGTCSRGADWTLKAKPDDGRLAVELEVDASRRGQTWTWRILHDGYASYHGSRVTRGPSGSFSVERRVVNMAGSDVIGFRAKNAAGQTCRGQLTY